jgi:GAF domain-containing protein
MTRLPEVRGLNPDDAMPAYPLSAAEQVLIETAISLTARLDVQQTCTAVLDAAERIYQARSSWVLLHDPAADELVAAAFRGPDAAAYANARIRLNRTTIVGKAFHDRESVFVADVQSEDRWFDPDRFHQSSLRTVFTVPLVFEGVALGIFGIDSAQFSPASPPGPAGIPK